ncbi:MAG: phytoene desaturase [Candidatus Xenobia bacterium]|jgi:phytoene desaturase
MKVGIIGSGLAGLSAACTLAARGHQVTVFEKNDWLGGKAAVLEKDGFRFDMGPTILTLPEVIFRIFREANRKVESYLDLVRLDPQWRCFFDDGSVLDLVEDTESMGQRIQQFSGPLDQAGFRRFMVHARELHDISRRYFFYKPVSSVGDIMKSRGVGLGPLKDLTRMRPGQTVFQTVRSYIKDPRVAQMLDHFTQYVGSSPDASPAVLCGIAHMQTGEGVWYPMGGTRAVPVALEKLGRELGVEYRTGVRIERFEVSGNQVQALVTEQGERHEFDALVSNMDAVRTYRELAGGESAKKFERLRKYEPACSGVVFYWGLKKQYPQFLHHDFVFSRDPEEEFEAIYRKGEPAPDPSLYLAVTTRTEPATAPPGCESFYCLVHTPYLRPHHDWSKMLPEYRKVILQKLARCAGARDLEENIVVEEVLTPQGIHDRYAVLNGAIYGLASHGRLNGAFKPHNRSPFLKNLYLAGGAAHPGPGMPMVMMSGWIAADVLDNDRKGARQSARELVPS